MRFLRQRGRQGGSRMQSDLKSDTPPRLWPTVQHPYQGGHAVLATKHNKLELIAPPLQDAIGLLVTSVEVDTDLLGTFTGEIERRLPPLETAIEKARLGMRLSGRSLGLASEGSIGPSPSLPLITVDRELIVLVDDEADVVISESYESTSVRSVSRNVRPGDPLEELMERADFPHHHLIVRPVNGQKGPIIKGINTLETLIDAVAACGSSTPDGVVTVESDLRATASPSRRLVIAEAAQRLAMRLLQRCPLCHAPGWGPVAIIDGVPCSSCSYELPLPRAVVHGCPSCEHRETIELDTTNERDTVRFCPSCNP